MSPNDVARQLGMIRSPAQMIYQEERRRGTDKVTARRRAIEHAPQRAATQTALVLSFIRQHAIWTIPDEAFPIKLHQGSH